MSETGMAVRTVTTDELAVVKNTVAQGATDAELKLFLYDCQRQGVHPLDRLLHFTKRGGKYTPITSIDLMRARAADTGEHAGTDDARFSEDGSECTVTVYRLVQLQRYAFGATARMSEYHPPAGQDHMWKKMPKLMLSKVAEALALRKAFPRQLAGFYAREEMDQAGESEAEQAKPARRGAKPGEANGAGQPTQEPARAGAAKPSGSPPLDFKARFLAIGHANSYRRPETQLRLANSIRKLINLEPLESLDAPDIAWEAMCVALEARAEFKKPGGAGAAGTSSAGNAEPVAAEVH